MVNVTPPFNVDLAGSFLVPQSLKDAREQYRKDQNQVSLRIVEDSEINNLVNKLKSLGLKVVTDGHFRSDNWPYSFMSQLDGLELKSNSKNSLVLTGRISVHRHPVIADFVFLTGMTGGDVIAKQVLPAPSWLLSEIMKDENGNLGRIYPDKGLLLEDIVSVYRKLTGELYDSGCRYLQFDDPKRIINDDAVYVNNASLENTPANFYIAYHASVEMLFSIRGVNAYLLDYDSECCERNRLLWFVKEKKAAFGFIPSHYPLEDELDEFRLKIGEVTRYIPLNRFTLCVPNAQVLPAESYEMAEQKQWNTLDMAMRVAEEIFPAADN